jgi:hypothetical protein
MLAVQTDAQRLAKRWKEQGRIQALERAKTRSLGEQVR